jgi:LCP family protein required for cell wall assembly
VTSEAGDEQDLTSEPFTVLLIGNADGLSDTMILCSVNPISMRVTMSSLARDSYVPITCYGGAYNKLNSANAVSRDCLISTIEELVGVSIDYYVETNFEGVVEIVDALGGIVVDNDTEFVGQTSSSTRGTYTVWVPAGDDVVLNGEQALAFARERYAYATGDFARQEHQHADPGCQYLPGCAGCGRGQHQDQHLDQSDDQLRQIRHSEVEPSV